MQISVSLTSQISNMDKPEVLVDNSVLIVVSSNYSKLSKKPKT